MQALETRRLILRKCGFRYYRDTTHESKQLDKPIDAKDYIMTKEDYENYFCS
ncbi:MAG: hypothetical protein FWB76_03510 [Oscillospiraceae bacterium]|nr:hypothetical protein [Oscillospiraceae bacterium]